MDVVNAPVLSLDAGEVQPETLTLDEFKGLVRQYMAADTWLKQAREHGREKRQLRDRLAETIAKFMERFELDEINSKDGRIRCKKVEVKPSTKKNDIKSRLEEVLQDTIADPTRRDEVIKRVFSPPAEEQDEENMVRQVTKLRRLKPLSSSST
jgi:hypothetical protein